MFWCSKEPLIETVLLSTHNICLVEKKENYFLVRTLNKRPGVFFQRTPINYLSSVILHAFCHLLIFSKVIFYEKFFRASKRMDPDQTNCFVLSDLGISADDISVEGKESKCEPDILFVEHRPDQIPQNVLSLPSVRKRFGSRS